MINQNFYKAFAIELGSQDLDHGSWIIQIIKFGFGSMGHSLSLLHTFGKLNRNYLPASAVTMFNVFPHYLD